MDPPLKYIDYFRLKKVSNLVDVQIELKYYNNTVTVTWNTICWIYVVEMWIVKFLFI